MRRPSPSLVLSSLALLVALSGTAVAAGGLVTSRDIKDRTIQIRDLSPAAVKALRGQKGDAGAAGPQGSQGMQGPQGQAGTNGGFDPVKLTRSEGPTTAVAPGATKLMAVYCPSDTFLISGGFVVLDGALRPTSDYPNLNGGVYIVELYNEGASPGRGYAMAVCAAR